VKHSCERISQLASEELERELSFSERWAMRFHFLMCDSCKFYYQNLLKLHETFNLKRKEMIEDATLPEDKRHAIHQLLQKLVKHTD